MTDNLTERGIPRSMAPFSQEYDIDALHPASERHTLIERTLRWGSRAEIRWLCHRYGE